MPLGHFLFSAQEMYLSTFRLGFERRKHTARSEASTVAEACPAALSDLKSKTNKELSDGQDESS